jgi:hypothetical protein
MMKIFPERTLGFEVDYPERIVRISTTALDDPDAADLPPGCSGRCGWIFRLAGPVLWGIVFGLQLSVIQFLFQRTRCTRQSSVVFVVLVFIVALPLNTGRSISPSASTSWGSQRHSCFASSFAVAGWSRHGGLLRTCSIL